MDEKKYEHEFYTIDEFAKLLRVHTNTIRRSIKSGRINAFRVTSGKKPAYRISRSEINRIAILDLEDIIEKMIEERMSKKDSGNELS